MTDTSREGAVVPSGAVRGIVTCSWLDSSKGAKERLPRPMNASGFESLSSNKANDTGSASIIEANSDVKCT